MEIEYDFTLEDLQAFYTHVHLATPQGRKRMMTSYFGTVFSVLVITVLLVLLTARDYDPWPLVLFVLFYVLAAPILYVRTRSRIRRRVRQMTSPGESVGLFGHQYLQMLPEGIREIGAGTDMLVRWASVNEIMDTAKHIIVYRGPLASSIVIPKRAFAREEDINEFVQTARERLKNASR